MAEGGAGRGGMCTVTSVVCPAPRGLALALSRLCLLLGGPQGLIWSPGTGQPGSKGRGEIRRGERGLCPPEPLGKEAAPPQPHSQGLSPSTASERRRPRHRRKTCRHPPSLPPVPDVSGRGRGGLCPHAALLQATLGPAGLRRAVLPRPLIDALCPGHTRLAHTPSGERRNVQRAPTPPLHRPGTGGKARTADAGGGGGRRRVSLPHCPQRLLRPLPPP